MGQVAPCMLCVLVCLAIQVHHAVDATSVSQRNSVFQGVPSSDVEFFNMYLNFVNSRNHKVYMPVAIVSIIIGVAGNVCFFFFFANPASSAYLTRDALYLRRLAGADTLICVLVIPYSVCFEAKLIHNSAMCKALEYARNVLTLSSHLLLISFCLEFNEDNNYALSKLRLDRSTLIIVVFASVVSTPALFIFDGGTAVDFSYLLQTNSSRANLIVKFPVRSTKNGSLTAREVLGSSRYSYFRPNFCHMSLNYDATAKYYQVIRALENIHFMTFGFVLFASVVLVSAMLMQFVESNPLIGRESMFVHFIEVDNPDVSAKLERMAGSESRESRSRQRSRISKKLQRFSAEENIQNTLATKRRSSSADAIREVLFTSVQNQGKSIDRQRSFSVDKEVQDAVPDEETGQLTPPADQQAASYETFKAASKGSNRFLENPGNRRLSLGNKSISKKSNMGDDDYEMVICPVDQHRRNSTRQHSVSSDNDLSLVRFLCCCECVRSQGRYVKQVGQQSYKKSLACLIMLDILIACATIILYLISDQRSVALNLIHVKSVFAFYIISFFHRDLRRATWGIARCGGMCL